MRRVPYSTPKTGHIWLKLGVTGVLMKKLLIAILLLGSVLPALAQTRYVSDVLTIYMRSGPGLNYSIKKSLKSGTELKVVTVDKAAGWTQVRIPGGGEGWVLSRQLDSQAVARDRIAYIQRDAKSRIQKAESNASARIDAAEQKAKSQVASIQSDLNGLQTTFTQTRRQLNTTTSAKSEVDSNLQRLETENAALKRELEQIKKTASRAIQLSEDNKQLTDQRTKLERELRVEKQATSTLRSRAKRDWFLIGAGVIVLGILIGLIAPRLRPKRANNWDAL